MRRLIVIAAGLLIAACASVPGMIGWSPPSLAERATWLEANGDGLSPGEAEAVQHGKLLIGMPRHAVAAIYGYDGYADGCSASGCWRKYYPCVACDQVHVLYNADQRMVHWTQF